MSRRLRLLLLLLAGVATLLVLTLLGLYLAAGHEPACYREAMQTDPAVLEKGSDQMLKHATALAGSVKKKHRWEALFTADEINGWLAVDMVRNHPNALPPGMRDPRVIIGSRQIIVACRFHQSGADSVLTLTLEPSVPEPNVIAIRIVRARAGLLPLPLGQVLDRLSEAARDMQVDLQWRRVGGDPVAMISLSPSDDDRPVHIEALRLADGEIYVAGGTERP